jgi:hypothetical protein
MRPGRLAQAIAVALAAAGLWSASAAACSAAEGYRIPTNFELVEKAELIVLARIIGTMPSDGATDPADSYVLIEPIKVLKGDAPAGPLKLFGQTDWNGNPIPSMPTVLRSSHFSAGLGACIRVFYPTQGLVLAMFERGPEGLMQVSDAWARAVEDVEAEDGLWVRAVEEYLAVQRSAANGNMREAVEARRRQLLDRRDVAGQAMASDLGDHLRVTSGQPLGQPSPRWVQIDMPLVSSAVIPPREKGSKLGGFLLCEKGKRRVQVHLAGVTRAAGLTLALGERRFQVEQVGPRKMGDMSTVGGYLPLTPELIEAMASETGESGIEAAGGVAVRAPPLDTLQKLALRCRALLRP